MSINQVFNNSDMRQIIFKKQSDEVRKIKSIQNYQNVLDEYTNMVKYCKKYMCDDFEYSGDGKIVLNIIWETINDVGGFGDMFCVDNEERLWRQELRCKYFETQPQGYKKAGLLGYEYGYDLINGGLIKLFGDSDSSDDESDFDPTDDY